jgi:hypothetical protein
VLSIALDKRYTTRECLSKDNQSTVVPTTSFTVTIKGPNGLKSKNLISLQMISDLLMVKFILPATGLTGNYTMQAEEPKIMKRRASILGQC